MVCWMAAVSLVVPSPFAPKSATLRAIFGLGASVCVWVLGVIGCWAEISLVRSESAGAARRAWLAFLRKLRRSMRVMRSAFDVRCVEALFEELWGKFPREKFALVDLFCCFARMIRNRARARDGG